MNIKHMVLLAAIAAPLAQAEDMAVVVGFGSHHYFTREYNENNPAIGMRYGNWDAIFIGQNSVGQHSVQVAYSQRFFTVDATGTEFRWRVGLASGYHKNAKWSQYYYVGNPFELGHSGIIPIVAIDIHQHLIGGLDAVIDFTPAVAMFGMEWKF